MISVTTFDGVEHKVKRETLELCDTLKSLIVDAGDDDDISDMSIPIVNELGTNETFERFLKWAEFYESVQIDIDSARNEVAARDAADHIKPLMFKEKFLEILQRFVQDDLDKITKFAEAEEYAEIAKIWAPYRIDILFADYMLCTNYLHTVRLVLNAIADIFMKPSDPTELRDSAYDRAFAMFGKMEKRPEKEEWDRIWKEEIFVFDDDKKNEEKEKEMEE